MGSGAQEWADNDQGPDRTTISLQRANRGLVYAINVVYVTWLVFMVHGIRRGVALT
jgi:hypothetical protein